MKNMAKPVYCQYEQCGRDITLAGGVISGKKVYCSFTHAGIDQDATKYFDVKGLQKMRRRGELVEFGHLEKSASD